MLDFYLIKDEQPKPNDPEQAKLKFIIGMNSKTFENLIKKRIIDSRFDYYSDFRWNNQFIKQIKTKTINNNNSDSDIERLNTILKKAIESKCGIIAYSD